MTDHPHPLAAAAASVDITPDESLPLAGYGDRHGPYDQVADRLEANVLLLRLDDAFVTFISCDLLFVGQVLRQRLEALLPGIPSERLFISATHTHFAPATVAAMPELGRASLEYIEKVAQEISAAVQALLQLVLPAATVELRQGQSHAGIHRRLPVVRWRLGWPPRRAKWEMRPNEDVAIDTRLRILSITDTNDRLLAICWSYACHPVCYPDKTHLSADFPGVVRQAIRERFGDVPVLFWQGFAGDIRPRAIVASDPPSFGPFTATQWHEWSNGLAENVLAAIEMPGQAVAGRIAAVRRQIPLPELGLNGGDRSISIHEVRLGDSLELFGIAAEPVNAYAAKLEAARGETTVVGVGYIDDVPCYLPTDEMLAQGGYEVTGFRRLFGVSGRFRRGIEARIVREFERRPLRPSPRD